MSTHRLRAAVEKRTGFVFGSYRPTEFDGPVWLVIAPPAPHHRALWSVVIGSRGFYAGRIR